MTTSSTPNDFTIRRASEADADVVAEVVRASFATEIPAYGTQLPPLSESSEDVRAVLGRGVVLVAERDGRVVGSVRGELIEDGTCLVGRLVVLPEARRLGIARELAIQLERLFPDARRFEIFTGHLSVGPLALYESLGYRRFREQPVSPTTTLIFLDKAGPAHD